MGQPDQTTPVGETERNQRSSRLAGGRLSTTRRYLGRATTSGALSAIAGVAMLARAARSLLRGDRRRALARGALAGGWFAAAAAQRRSGRRGRLRDDVGPVGIEHPEGGASSGARETADASGDTLTGRRGPSGEASGSERSRRGADADAEDVEQSDVVGQDIEPTELRGMTDESEESDPEGDDERHPE